MLHQAALQPFIFEDYETHLDTHATFMKSVEFGKLPEEVQDDFITHYQQTLQTLMSLPQKPEPKAVQTTLQLKGTIGPTAASEVLNRSGVLDVTPEQMAEQPLETWVSDSLDKPNVESAGNEPIQAAIQDAKMLQEAGIAQNQADMQSMQTAHKAALDHAAAVQDRQQSADVHEQKMRHAEAAHLEKLRASRQQAAQKPAGK
jgi:hypothetical protein